MPSLWLLEPPNPIPPSLVEVAIVAVTAWGEEGGYARLSRRSSRDEKVAVVADGDSCGIIGVSRRVETRNCSNGGKGEAGRRWREGEAGR